MFVNGPVVRDLFAKNRDVYSPAELYDAIMISQGHPQRWDTTEPLDRCQFLDAFATTEVPHAIH